MFYFNLTALISGIGFAAFVLITPIFANELNLNFTETGLLMAAFSLSMIIFSPIWGSLSDRLHRRKIFIVAGSLLFAAASFLYVFVNDFQTLLLLRFLQGIGFAATPLLTALFSDHMGVQTARSFSIFSAATALGWGLGNLMAGLLGDEYGVRAVFEVVPLFTILSVLVIQFALPDHPGRQTQAKAQSRLPGKLFYLFASIFVRQSMAMSLWVIFPIYLKSFVNNSLTLVGLVSGVNALFQPLFMLLAGRISEERGQLQLVFIGILGTIAAFVVFAVANNIWLMILGQIMVAFFWALLFIGINVYIMEEVDAESRGKAFGFVQATFTSATAIGPFFGGVISDAVGIQQMIFIVSIFMILSFPFLFRLQYLDRRAKRRAAISSAEPVLTERDRE